MAFQAYVSIKGSKQGQFKGETTKANRKDWVAVLAFSMQLKSPRDAATGLPTGKRHFEPVTFVKEWGAASPQGLTACSTNELLTTVSFEFMKTGPAGEELISQTVTLTDAVLVQVVRSTADPGEALGSLAIPSGTNTRQCESWSFTFRKIQVADNEGKTSYADDWSTPAV